MSFVALALLSQAMSFDRQFLIIAAIVLAFDLIIGLTTYGRIIGANADDLRAVHGMSRIRHGYTQIAPIVAPYFVTGTHDDSEGVMISYGSPPSTYPAVIFYGLTTSGGMIGLILGLVGGVEAAVLGLLLGVNETAALLLGIGGFLVVLGALIGFTVGRVPGEQQRLPAMFPTPPPAESDPADHG
jgi:hypothetical protein